MRARGILWAGVAAGVVALSLGLQAQQVVIEQVSISKTSNIWGGGRSHAPPLFYPSDEAAYCAAHVYIPRTGTQMYYQLTMRWYAPDKTLYQTDRWELTRDANTNIVYLREGVLRIRGTRAETLLGTWRVVVEIAFGPSRDITFKLERDPYSPVYPPTPAPPTVTPPPRAGLRPGASWSEVISWAKPAVVFIQGETGKTDEKGQKLYSTGSGVIISSDGYILTAAHVIAEITGKIEVLVEENRSYTASVVKVHPKWDPKGEGFSGDVALLKISATGLAWLPLGNSDALAPEEEIRVLGYPRAGALGLGLIPATGRVLGIRRQPGLSFVQIDTSLLDKGHSGGPVINSRGEVVGIAMGTFVSGETGVRHHLAVAVNTAKEIVPTGLRSHAGQQATRPQVECVLV